MPRPRVPLNKDPFIWIMIGLYLVCILGMVITFASILWKVRTDDRIGEIFLVRMLQITLGMVIGSTMTFLGMLTAWFGLNDEMSGEAEVKDLRLKLAAASPGALLILTGTFLIYVCVSKEVEHTETSGTDFIDQPPPITQNFPASHFETPVSPKTDLS